MNPPLPRFPRNRSGFTLVEVTLAIAVALIGIVGVLALLPQGMQSARSAVDSTISATLVQDIFSQLHIAPYNDIVICIETNTCANSVKLNLTQTQLPANPKMLFFDQTGAIVNTATVTSDTYYQMNLSYQPQQNLQQQNLSLSLVTATVIWPALSLHPANTNSYTTLVTWYTNPP